MSWGDRRKSGLSDGFVCKVNGGQQVLTGAQLPVVFLTFASRWRWAWGWSRRSPACSVSVSCRRWVAMAYSVFAVAAELPASPDGAGRCGHRVH
jgi:hypothetical protein